MVMKEHVTQCNSEAHQNQYQFYCQVGFHIQGILLGMLVRNINIYI